VSMLCLSSPSTSEIRIFCGKMSEGFKVLAKPASVRAYTRHAVWTSVGDRRVSVDLSNERVVSYEQMWKSLLSCSMPFVRL